MKCCQGTIEIVSIIKTYTKAKVQNESECLSLLSSYGREGEMHCVDEFEFLISDESLDAVKILVGKWFSVFSNICSIMKKNELKGKLFLINIKSITYF